MEVRETTLADVLTFRPVPVVDDRGWFTRTFSADVAVSAGLDPSRFVQDSQSRSRRATIRGLHLRRDLSEGKLVRVARGAVFEVVVDLRPWSPTFLAQEHFTLDDVEHLQLLVPPGCAHGFQVVSDAADVCYRIDAYYEPALDAAVAWDDPELAVPWPLPDPVLSARDRDAPSLREVRPQLASWFGSRP